MGSTHDIWPDQKIHMMVHSFQFPVPGYRPSVIGKFRGQEHEQLSQHIPESRSECREYACPLAYLACVELPFFIIMQVRAQLMKWSHVHSGRVFLLPLILLNQSLSDIPKSSLDRWFFIETPVIPSCVKLKLKVEQQHETLMMLMSQRCPLLSRVSAEFFHRHSAGAFHGCFLWWVLRHVL